MALPVSYNRTCHGKWCNNRGGLKELKNLEMVRTDLEPQREPLVGSWAQSPWSLAMSQLVYIIVSIWFKYDVTMETFVCTMSQSTTCAMSRLVATYILHSPPPIVCFLNTSHKLPSSRKVTNSNMDPLHKHTQDKKHPPTYTNTHTHLKTSHGQCQTRT